MANQRQPQFARHYIDLTTSLYFVGQPAMGILRTEREIAKRLLSDQRLRAVPVAFWQDQLFILEPEDVDLLLRDTPPAISTIPPPDVRPAPPGFRNRLKRGVRAVARRLVGLAPAYSREDLRWALFFAMRFARAIRNRAPNPAFEAIGTDRDTSSLNDARNKIRARLLVAAAPGSHDVFWTCGHLALLPFRRLAEQKLQAQFRVAAMGYDVIRIRHPEWNTQEEPRELFVANTIDLIDTADLIYCISRHTGRGLAGFAADAGRPKPRLKLVRLGADLPLPEHSSDDAAGARLPRLSGRPFALAVGTVEARKNYALLLKVWQTLSDEPDFDLDLVIVGRPGIGATASIAELRTSPLIGKRIFWLEDCPDTVLHGLYRRCRLVLCPSLMEGWGLPVSEGLAHGKPVVCSDRGALPEAAMGRAMLRDPADWMAWVDTIRSLAKAPVSSNASLHLPTWDAAADRISRGLLAMSRPATCEG
ncbi:MAG: glycosyltransferase [Xanthobacteraceae bacterium]|nr:glycosyltransferase [Xanthobacteraceae bacterium]